MFAGYVPFGWQVFQRGIEQGRGKLCFRAALFTLLMHCVVDRDAGDVHRLLLVNIFGELGHSVRTCRL